MRILFAVCLFVSGGNAAFADYGCKETQELTAKPLLPIDAFAAQLERLERRGLKPDTLAWRDEVDQLRTEAPITRMLGERVANLLTQPLSRRFLGVSILTEEECKAEVFEVLERARARGLSGREMNLLYERAAAFLENQEPGNYRKWARTVDTLRLSY